MGEFFRILPSITGLCCPLVKSCEITLICLHFPPKRTKRLVLFKSRARRGKVCETHDLRGGKSPELSRKYDWANWQTGTKAPLSADCSTNCADTNCLHQPVFYSCSVTPLRTLPGVFNWNLSLQEGLICTSATLFPLFWHLKATSVSPSTSTRKRQLTSARSGK